MRRALWLFDQTVAWSYDTLYESSRAQQEALRERRKMLGGEIAEVFVSEPSTLTLKDQKKLAENAYFVYDYLTFKEPGQKSFLTNPLLEDAIFKGYRELLKNANENDANIIKILRLKLILETFSYASKENLDCLLQGSPRPQLSSEADRQQFHIKHHELSAQAAFCLLLAPNFPSHLKTEMTVGYSLTLLSDLAYSMMNYHGPLSAKVDLDISFKLSQALLPDELDSYLEYSGLDPQVLDMLRLNWEGSLRELIVSVESLSSEMLKAPSA